MISEERQIGVIRSCDAFSVALDRLERMPIVFRVTLSPERARRVIVAAALQTCFIVTYCPHTYRGKDSKRLRQRVPKAREVFHLFVSHWVKLRLLNPPASTGVSRVDSYHPVWYDHAHPNKLAAQPGLPPPFAQSSQTHTSLLLPSMKHLRC